MKSLLLNKNNIIIVECTNKIIMENASKNMKIRNSDASKVFFSLYIFIDVFADILKTNSTVVIH
jgi:hypothetical protein